MMGNTLSVRPTRISRTKGPGVWNMHRMLQAADALPMNIGLLGKGNASLPQALQEQVAAGAHCDGSFKNQRLLLLNGEPRAGSP